MSSLISKNIKYKPGCQTYNRDSANNTHAFSYILIRVDWVSKRIKWQECKTDKYLGYPGIIFHVIPDTWK